MFVTNSWKTCSPISAMLLASRPRLLVVVQKPAFAIIGLIIIFITIRNILKSSYHNPNHDDNHHKLQL